MYNGREGLLLNGCRSVLLDAAENGGVEDIKTGVDAVADELDGLLDEPIDARGVVRFVDNDTVLGGFLDLGHNDSSLIAVCLVERNQLLEGKLAGDVGVEHKEGRVVLSKNLFRQLQGPSSAKGLGFEREMNLETELVLVLYEQRVSKSNKQSIQAPRGAFFRILTSFKTRSIISGR